MNWALLVASCVVISLVNHGSCAESSEWTWGKGKDKDTDARISGKKQFQ